MALRVTGFTAPPCCLSFDVEVLFFCSDRVSGCFWEFAHLLDLVHGKVGEDLGRLGPFNYEAGEECFDTAVDMSVCSRRAASTRAGHYWPKLGPLR